jgi:hypothetical protein
MSRKEWIAVIVVIGLGIVWQIPRHDDAMPAGAEPHALSPAEVQPAEGERPSEPAAAAEPVGPYRTIALEVTGMT